MLAIIAYFVQIFETDSRWLRRVLAAGACGLAMSVAIVLKHGEKFSLTETIAVLMVLPACFMLAGCLLATIDYVRTRIQSGAKIGWLTRVFFGSMLSLWVWFVLLLFIGFPIAVFIGSLTWKR